MSRICELQPHVVCAPNTLTASIFCHPPPNSYGKSRLSFGKFTYGLQLIKKKSNIVYMSSTVDIINLKTGEVVASNIAPGILPGADRRIASTGGKNPWGSRKRATASAWQNPVHKGPPQRSYKVKIPNSNTKNPTGRPERSYEVKIRNSNTKNQTGTPERSYHVNNTSLKNKNLLGRYKAKPAGSPYEAKLNLRHQSIPLQPIGSGVPSGKPLFVSRLQIAINEAGGSQQPKSRSPVKNSNSLTRPTRSRSVSSTLSIHSVISNNMFNSPKAVKQLKEKRAILIQAASKGMKIRHIVRKHKKAATDLQKWARGALNRKKAERQKTRANREKAELELARSKMASMEKRAAIDLQKWARGAHNRKKAERQKIRANREKGAATYLQKWARSAHARRQKTRANREKVKALAKERNATPASILPAGRRSSPSRRLRARTQNVRVVAEISENIPALLIENKGLILVTLRSAQILNRRKIQGKPMLLPNKEARIVALSFEDPETKQVLITAMDLKPNDTLKVYRHTSDDIAMYTTGKQINPINNDIAMLLPDLTFLSHETNLQFRQNAGDITT